MPESQRLYLAGPMTGIADYNFPAFHAAAARIRKLGYAVFNPAETDGGDTSKPREYYLRLDIAELLQCDAIAVLPDWHTSRGATLEVAIAEQIGLPVLSAGTLLPIDATILDEAKRLVYGARRNDYGHPADDYARTAALWSVILGCPVTPQQAVMCMIGVKLSRQMNRPKRDNLTDIAGYAACLALIEERLHGSQPSSSE